MKAPSILIIGYGNPLRGDDGAGWFVAERLEGVSDAVDVQTTHQLLPELADPISRMQLVVFVDASVADAPGQVSCRPVVPAAEWSVRDTHKCLPEQLLACARELFGHAPEALLYCIGGEDFSLKETLTPAVEKASLEVVEAIRRLIQAREG